MGSGVTIALQMRRGFSDFQETEKDGERDMQMTVFPKNREKYKNGSE